MKCVDRLTNEAWVDWINKQNFKSWRIVTLKYSGSGDMTIWEKAIEHTFRELEQTFIRGRRLSENKDNGAGNRLRRVVAFGSNNDVGTILHAHCLVDGIGDDNIFEKILTQAWTRQMKKIIEEKCNVEYRKHSPVVYVEHTCGNCDKYFSYMVRQEGSEYANYMDKVVTTATYLN